jgi:mRNA-degrading endonuclease YafQ of YafQ-DinJ toxin-antitoxin module
MFRFFYSSSFEKNFRKVVGKNVELKQKFRKTLKLLKQDPFYPSLKSHKASTKNFGTLWSSWVTGDLRIVWEFDKKEKNVIQIKGIGTHKIYS